MATLSAATLHPAASVADAEHADNVRRARHIASAVPGLDRVLLDGLRLGTLHLVVGEPGAGKTILAHQVGALVARELGPVLYLTAFIETHHTLLHQARQLGLLEPKMLAERRFFYSSLAPFLEQGGLTAVREEIVRMVHDHAPALLILDGLHTLRLLGGDEREFHRLVVMLQSQAALTGTTTLAVTNYDGSKPGDAIFAIPDGIIHLRTERHAMREVRILSVEKMRGAAVLDGWHLFRVDREGMRVFPRLEAAVQAAALPDVQPGDHQCRFGVDGLDAMLDGGVSSGSVTLLAGAPGSGKTLYGLSFLQAGAEVGEPGLYVGFRETHDRVLAKAEGIGLQLQKHADAGTVRLVWIPPLEVLSDDLAEQILAIVNGEAPRGATGARFGPPPTAPVQRVFIDGLDDLRRTCLPESRFPGFLAALTDMLRSRNVATVMSQEFRRPFGLDLALPVEEMAGAVDNIMLLRYVEQRGRLRRLVSVLKMREHQYDSAIREFAISKTGVRVGDVFTAISQGARGTADDGDMPGRDDHSRPVDDGSGPTDETHSARVGQPDGGQ